MMNLISAPLAIALSNVVNVGIQKINVFVCLCGAIGGSNRLFDVGCNERVCSSSKIIIIIYSTQTQTHIVFISSMFGDITQ